MIASVLAFAAGTLGAAGAGLLLSRRRRVGSAGGRMVRLVSVLGRGPAVVSGAPQDLGRRLTAAGRPGGLGAREVMAAKAACAVAAAALATPAATVAPGRLGLLVVVGGPVAGFLAPDLWLVRLASERARAVRRGLPAMLDLLRVTVDAGASLPAALAEVGGRATGPLAAEWRAVGRQTQLGVPLSDALAAMAERLPQPEVVALRSALERARRQGAPLGRTLAAQARDTRRALRRHAQEEAARAGPKIQLVVALLLVPSVLLLVAAALTTALLDTGGLPSL